MKALTGAALFILATLSGAVAQPRFQEGFEGSAGLPAGWTVWNNAPFPIRPETNWTVRDTGVTPPGVAIVTTKAHTGLRAAGVTWWASTDTGGVPRIQADALLVTPRIPGIVLNEGVRFWASGGRGAFLDSLQVWASPFDSTPSGIFGGNYLGTVIWPAGSPYGVFTEHTFAFPVVDTSLYIAFRYFINCTNAGFYVHVDDVSVDAVTGVGPGDDPVPEVLALMPNFPNPFNPSTTLRFTVPQRADLVLTVYDLLGREVAKPAAGTFGPGTYSVVWDARGMASGAYVARLTGGGASATRMMVLAR